MLEKSWLMYCVHWLQSTVTRFVIAVIGSQQWRAGYDGKWTAGGDWEWRWWMDTGWCWLFLLLPSARRLCFCHWLSVCLSVCLLANLCKNFLTDLHDIFSEGWQWASEQMIKFCWQSGSGIWIRIWIWMRIRILVATLVRCALAEVCTVLRVVCVCAQKIGSV